MKLRPRRKDMEHALFLVTGILFGAVIAAIGFLQFGRKGLVFAGLVVLVYETVRAAVRRLVGEGDRSADEA